MLLQRARRKRFVARFHARNNGFMLLKDLPELTRRAYAKSPYAIKLAFALMMIRQTRGVPLHSEIVR